MLSKTVFPKGAGLGGCTEEYFQFFKEWQFPSIQKFSSKYK